MAGLTTNDVGGCCCPSAGRICVHATNCGGTPISGATATVTQSGVTIGTCTTDSSGFCCVTGLADGTYHVDVSKSGLPTWSDNATITGGSTVDLYPLMDASHRFRLDVTGCHFFPLPGATVTVNGGTYTTDSGGQVFVSAPTGLYPYSVSKPPRFTTATGTVNIVACASGVQAVFMGIATGYQCYVGCADPISETLHLSDSVHGGVTLAYSAVADNWSGSIHFDFAQICPGLRFCPSSNGVLLGYVLQPDGTFGCPYSPGPGASLCPFTDTGQPYSTTGPDHNVSTTCSPFERVFTVDPSTCPFPSDAATFWGLGGATLTLTE